MIVCHWTSVAAAFIPAQHGQGCLCDAKYFIHPTDTYQNGYQLLIRMAKTWSACSMWLALCKTLMCIFTFNSLNNPARLLRVYYIVWWVSLDLQGKNKGWKKLSRLLKVTQLESGREHLNIWIFVLWTEYLSHPKIHMLKPNVQ